MAEPIEPCATAAYLRAYRRFHRALLDGGAQQVEDAAVAMVEAAQAIPEAEYAPLINEFDFGDSPKELERAIESTERMLKDSVDARRRKGSA